MTATLTNQHICEEFGHTNIFKMKPLPRGCKAVQHFYITIDGNVNDNTTLLTTSLVDVSRFTGHSLEDIIDALDKANTLTTTGRVRKHPAKLVHLTKPNVLYHVEVLDLSDGIHTEYFPH